MAEGVDTTRRDLAARRFEAVLGREHVDAARRPELVGGDLELPRAHPADAARVAELLRACAAEGLALHVEGGGGCPAAHLPPARLDGILSLDRLSGVLEHEPADLVARVEGGCTLATLQQALAPSHQFFPVEVGAPHEATIGGILASRAAGPSRLRYGTPRDRLLGLAFVDGAGRLIRAGARVVKNVAGYDLMKLLVGSWGTLGVIAEVTLRVDPAPPARSVWVAMPPRPETMARFLHVLRRCDASPAFLTVANPGRTAALDPRLGGWTVAAGLDGDPEAIDEQRRRLEEVRREVGWREGDTRWLAGLEAVAWSRHAVTRLGSSIGADVGIEVHVPPGRALEVLGQVRVLPAGEEHSPVHPLHVQVDAGSGIAALAWRHDATDSRAFLWSLLGPAQEAGGFLRILHGPPELRREAARWGPQPPALAIARRLKEAFDPRGIFAPGRMPGGI